MSGATLRVFFAPGHADDHVVLLLSEAPNESPEEQLRASLPGVMSSLPHKSMRRVVGMFTGDNVLGIGTTVFEDLALYMESLEMMKQLTVELDIEVLFPGMILKLLTFHFRNLRFGN